MKKKINTLILLPFLLCVFNLSEAQIISARLSFSERPRDTVKTNVPNTAGPKTLTINIFKVKSDSAPFVELYFIVTMNGKKVTGLRQNDFEIKEQGRKCNVISFEEINKPVNISMVLDHSSSMKLKLGTIKEEAKIFVSRFDPEYNSISVVGIGTDIDENFPLTKDRLTIDHEISKMLSYGSTSLFDGIYAGIKDIEKSRGNRSVVVVTNGGDNSSDISNDELAKYLKRDSIPLYVVNVGESYEYDYRLQEIAEVSGGTYYQADARTGLGSVERIIKNKMGRDSYYKLVYRVDEQNNEKCSGQISVRVGDTNIINAPVSFEYENKNANIKLPVAHYKEDEKKGEVSSDQGR